MAGLKINITEKSVNRKNNTSYVRVDLYLYGNGVSWNAMRPSGYLYIENEKFNFRASFSRSRNAQKLFTAYKTIKHLDNGKKHVDCSAKYYTDTSAFGTLSASAGKQLTTIKRAVPKPTTTSTPTPTETYKDFPSSLTKIWQFNIGKTTEHTKFNGKMGILGQYATASDYGTGADWHGSSITRILDTAINNFTLDYQQVFAAKSIKELGLFACYCLDESNNIIAGIKLIKKPTALMNVYLIAQNKEIQTFELDARENNHYFGIGNKAVKTSQIVKYDNRLNFNIGGIKKQFTITGLQNSTIKKVEFHFMKFRTTSPLAYNGLYSCRLRKDWSYYQDIPNIFAQGDKLEINCKDGSVNLNGLERPELGALGNDWETFLLKKGQNQIGLAYSDFGKLEAKLLYREAYL